VDEVQRNGRFLKRGDRCWVEVGRMEARLKAAHALQYQQRRHQVGELDATEDQSLLPASVLILSPGVVKQENVKRGQRRRRRATNHNEAMATKRQKNTQKEKNATQNTTNIHETVQDFPASFHVHSSKSKNAKPSSSFHPINDKTVPYQIAATRRKGKRDPNERDECDIFKSSTASFSDASLVQSTAQALIASCGEPAQSSTYRFSGPKKTPDKSQPTIFEASSLDVSGIHSLSDDELQFDEQESLSSILINTEADPWQTHASRNATPSSTQQHLERCFDVINRKVRSTRIHETTIGNIYHEYLPQSPFAAVEHPSTTIPCQASNVVDNETNKRTPGQEAARLRCTALHPKPDSSSSSTSTYTESYSNQNK
jgi:hypothetical protein